MPPSPTVHFRFLEKNGKKRDVIALFDGMRVHLDCFDPSSAKLRDVFLARTRTLLADLGVGVEALKDIDRVFLDALFTFEEELAAQEMLKGTPLVADPPSPWPDPVSGAEVLDEIAGFVRSYCVLPDGAVEALSLWSLHSYVFRLFDIAPRIALLSPTKRCGKSTVLSVLAALVQRPMPGAVLTGPAIFHAVEEYQPTILVDEFDLCGSKNAELGAVFNAGHRSDGAVPRVKKTYRCFCPVAVAAILNSGRPSIPETLRDRSIEVHMVRKGPDEMVMRFRSAEAKTRAEPLRRKCLRWAHDNAVVLRTLDPNVDVLSVLDDRALDNWTPLLAIADAAQGQWPATARKVALTLSSSRSEEEEQGMVLLTDLKCFFETKKVRKAATRDIVGFLQACEEGVWSSLTPYQLARFLRPFGVRPRTLRLGSEVMKGYEAADMETAWRHYLGVTGVTPVTPLPDQDA